MFLSSGGVWASDRSTFSAAESFVEISTWVRIWIYLYLSYVQIQPCNCLYSAIAFLENWRIDAMLMEVLQDEKIKELKKTVKVSMNIEILSP